jgi:glycosyltransferase involved in cell wall biosynthesis
MATITWLCANRAKTLCELQNSNLASIRLRTAVSLEALVNHGSSCIVTDGSQYQNTDLIIAGKIDYASDPSRPSRWLEYLSEGKRRGAEILIDYTDNHLCQESAAASFYKESFSITDRIITSSEALRREAKKYFSGDIVVIEDPIEVEIQAPKQKTNQFPNALWFGHASNLRYLISYLEKVTRNSLRNLTALSNFENSPFLTKNLVNAAKSANIALKIIPWSNENLIKHSKTCDVCILPAGINDDRKKGASLNRLLTALALGIPTAAHVLESYLKFGEFFFDLSSGDYPDFIRRFDEYHAKTAHAQTIIKRDYTKNILGSTWVKSLEKKRPTSKIASKFKDQPLLNILVITYNQEWLCNRLIRNIESYACDDIHVLIQDDCSEDKTFIRLEKHFRGNKFVKVDQNTRNMGARESSSTLIKKAYAGYCLGLGGDDFIIPEQIKKIVEVLNRDTPDFGVFRCVHANLTSIDAALFSSSNAEKKINGVIRNDNLNSLDGKEFFRRIATMPGAFWCQGLAIKTNLLSQIKLLDGGDVDDWGLCHNIAVHSHNHALKYKVYDNVSALLAIIPQSNGSDPVVQLNRQITAVKQYWHESYKKEALVNVIQKKLEQFRQSAIDPETLLEVLKQAL